MRTLDQTTIKNQVLKVFLRSNTTIQQKLNFDTEAFVKTFLIIEPNIKPQTVSRYLRVSKNWLTEYVRHHILGIVEKYKNTDDSLEYVISDYFRGSDWVTTEKNLNNNNMQYFYNKSVELIKELDIDVNAFESDQQLQQQK